MTTGDFEALSALLDDELGSVETARTLDRLARDEASQAAWRRYQQIGAALRGERMVLPNVDLQQAVARRLGDEPPILAPRHPPEPVRSWLRPAVGAAIAASVAALAVIIAPLLTPQQTSPIAPSQVAQQVAQPSTTPAATGAPATIELAAASATPTAEVDYEPEPGIRWAGEPQGRTGDAKLGGFLVNHQQYAPASGIKGVLRYTTVVSYDAHR